jgi:hypothetical protein
VTHGISLDNLAKLQDCMLLGAGRVFDRYIYNVPIAPKQKCALAVNVEKI